MMLLLIAVIIALLAAVVYLNVAFYREKKIYRERIESLHRAIAETSKKQLGQQEQLKLSEQLDESLKTSRSVLSNDLFALGFDLFELLSKNRLLKK